MRTLVILVCFACTLTLVFGYFSIQESSAYKNCIAEHQTEATNPLNNNQIQNSPSVVFMCEAIFLVEHEQIVTAGATIFIALFTLILGIATIM
jgi:hypothetical protein